MIFTWKDIDGNIHEVDERVLLGLAPKKNCSNCKHLDKSITAEPCMNCKFTECWEPKEDDKDNENTNQDTI